jgi:hypothetical protein
MRNYRIYLLGTDGHIQFGADYPCENDDEALTCAARLLADNRGDVEVWESTRLIARLTHPGSRDGSNPLQLVHAGAPVA